jgi:hypothetical protein
MLVASVALFLGLACCLFSVSGFAHNVGHKAIHPQHCAISWFGTRNNKLVDKNANRGSKRLMWWRAARSASAAASGASIFPVSFTGDSSTAAARSNFPAMSSKLGKQAVQHGQWDLTCLLTDMSRGAMEFVRNEQLTVVGIAMALMSIAYGVWASNKQTAAHNSEEVGVNSEAFGAHEGSSKMPPTAAAVRRGPAVPTAPVTGTFDTLRRKLPSTGEVNRDMASSANQRRQAPQTKSKRNALGVPGASSGGAPPAVSAIASGAFLGPLGEQVPQANPGTEQSDVSALKSKQGGGQALNFLSKFFQKPGGGRSVDIAQALNGEENLRTFRGLCAVAMLDCVPSATFPDSVVSEVMAALSGGVHNSGVAGVEELKRCAAASGLSDEQAAGAFADVANALLVTLVDAAVRAAEAMDDVLCATHLDCVVNFIAQSGKLYYSLTPEVQVEPIRYNGKARAAQLEDLYYRCARSAADTSSVFTGGAPEVGADISGETLVDVPAGDPLSAYTVY